MFDPDKFLETATTEANATSFDPIPVGEYNAVIEEIKLTPRDDKYPLDVTWNIIDQELLQQMGREKLTVRQTVWLDMSPSGGLEHGKGKNVGLGKLREALGMNTPGKPFSVGMLRGAGPARINVVQVPKKDDDSVIYNNVKGVARA